MTPDDVPVLYSEFDKLERLWGEGFMSPGGPAEVARIVGEIDLSGSSVLDVGCGAGGATVTLLQVHGAAEVVGIDPMRHLVDYCRQRAERLGLDGLRYEIGPVQGRIPFPDASRDVIFSKDAILHEADKETLFGEIHRVLRPGGRLLMGDWMRGEGAHLDEQVTDLAGEIWTMRTLTETAALVNASGLVVDFVEDRQPWYAEQVVVELERIDSGWGEQFVESFGQEELSSLRSEWVDFAGAARSGALSPGIVRATKPPD
jgi:phosphoethanolamine N-methyltransferase